MSSQTPDASRPALNDLVQKCRNLCDAASEAEPDLKPEKRAFLEHSLGDALQQLELILRALGSESGKATRDESQGLLRRLFSKREAEGEGPETLPGARSHQGLQGNSWTIPLSELLGFLAFGRKSGVLWVDTLAENYMLLLEEGALRHATSDATPAGLRLGEVLVGFGFLTRRQLDRFLAKHADTSNLVVGEGLVESGLISEDELCNALTYQVQQLFFRLVGTPNAVFRFREGMEVSLAHRISLDVNHLLLQTAAAHDETHPDSEASRALDSLEDWGPEPDPASAAVADGESSEDANPKAEQAGASDGNTSASKATEAREGSEPESGGQGSKAPAKGKSSRRSNKRK